MNTSRCIIEHFPETTIKHIYREYNIESDALSKKVIIELPISIFYEELLKGYQYLIKHISFYMYLFEVDYWDIMVYDKFIT